MGTYCPSQPSLCATKDVTYLAFLGSRKGEDPSEPLLTCEAVLAEAAFHLGSSAYVFDLVRNEMLRVAFDCSRNLEPLADLARRYENRRPDLADLCVIRMSELYPRYLVITVDESDFRVYRRNKREVIPLLCPPSRRV